MSTSPALKTNVDIANRALQHCGATGITSLDDNDKNAAEVKKCLDSLRQAELRDNVWTFACKRAVLYPINTPISGAPFGTTAQPTLLLNPSEWNAGRQYPFGYIVQHNGTYWCNNALSSVGQEPGLDATTNWDVYFGSVCVNAWGDPTGDVPPDGVTTIGYFVGDLVYVGSQVFVSLQNSNVASPLDPDAWSSTVVYSEGQTVADADGWEWRSFTNNNIGAQPGVYGMWSSAPTYSVGSYVIGSDRVLYKALVSNSNHNPASGASPTQWSAVGAPGSWPLWENARTYAENDYVAGTDGQVYQAVQGSNTNHQPVGATYNPNTPATNWWVPVGITVPWYANFGAGASNGAWLGIDASLDPINIMYPIGTGPSIQTQNKNIFFLPNGHLREAPQEPKAGSVSFLGAPTGRMYDDWEFNGNFIISQSPFPIIYRFVADVSQVPQMDAMFKEAWAARIGLEVCEPLTQATAKIATIERQYKRFMDRAKTTNGIEQGPTEAPEDDYITCRI
jgi:hypothetical protein